MKNLQAHIKTLAECARFAAAGKATVYDPEHTKLEAPGKGTICSPGDRRIAIRLSRDAVTDLHIECNDEFAWRVDDDGSPPDCDATEGSGAGVPAPQAAYFAAALARRIARGRQAGTFVPEAAPSAPPAESAAPPALPAAETAADAVGMRNGPTDGDATPSDAAAQSALPLEQPVITAAPPTATAAASDNPHAPSPSPAGTPTAEPVAAAADTALFESDCLLWKATKVAVICVGVPTLTALCYTIKYSEQANNLRKKLWW